jgi:hypothetical protein
MERKIGVISWVGSHDPGPFIFRFPYPCLYRGNVESPDMTLIASVWSPEGFAISADGLQIETGKPPKYDAQKIFHTPFRNDTGFAYACAGAPRFVRPCGQSFDFIRATKLATDDLANEPFPSDPASYFHEIGNRLFRELVDAEADIGLPESKLFLVGYGNGVPMWAELVFSNTGTRFYPPVLAYVTPSPRRFMVFSGSTTVYGDMEVAEKLSQPLNLREATSMVHEYAQTCVTGSASIEDCSNLGGHIHVATITKEGFSWVIEPIK